MYSGLTLPMEVLTSLTISSCSDYPLTSQIILSMNSKSGRRGTNVNRVERLNSSVLLACIMANWLKSGLNRWHLDLQVCLTSLITVYKYSTKTRISLSCQVWSATFLTSCWIETLSSLFVPEYMLKLKLKIPFAGVSYLNMVTSRLEWSRAAPSKLPMSKKLILLWPQLPWVGILWRARTTLGLAVRPFSRTKSNSLKSFLLGVTLLGTKEVTSCSMSSTR
jgi:hypothetical protein